MTSAFPAGVPVSGTPSADVEASCSTNIAMTTSAIARAKWRNCSEKRQTIDLALSQKRQQTFPVTFLFGVLPSSLFLLLCPLVLRNGHSSNGIRRPSPLRSAGPVSERLSACRGMTSPLESKTKLPPQAN